MNYKNEIEVLGTKVEIILKKENTKIISLCFKVLVFSCSLIQLKN